MRIRHHLRRERATIHVRHDQRELALTVSRSMASLVQFQHDVRKKVDDGGFRAVSEFGAVHTSTLRQIATASME